ncbi:MAG: hypothetical protein ACE5MI_04045 [Acidimicrobiia bacterium]
MRASAPFCMIRVTVLQLGSTGSERKEMFARVSTFQETPEGIAESLERNSEVVEKADAISGFKGLYYLVDRSSGKSVAITLWDTQDAMHRSEEAANQIREDESVATGGEIVSVERFEVAAAELR